MILSLLVGMCSCSEGVGIFRRDERTIDDFKREATEISVRILNRIFKGDYDTVKNFVSSDEAKQIKPVMGELSPEMSRSAMVIVEEVNIEEGSYDTDVHYRVTFRSTTITRSFSFVMKMERNGNGWVISNALPLFADMRELNETYLDWKRELDA